MNLSIHEAARHLGVSHAALIKARKAGLLEFEPDGKVNLEKVLASEWARNRAGRGEAISEADAPKRSRMQS